MKKEIQHRYKNVLVLKNYVSSFAANAEDDIDKTREKAAKASSSLGHRKTNPLRHVKSWRKACLRSLLLGSLLLGTELFTNECFKFECKLSAAVSQTFFMSKLLNPAHSYSNLLV